MLFQVDTAIDGNTLEEWLVVQYGHKKKNMQRFSDCLRPISDDGLDPYSEDYDHCMILVSQIVKRLKAAEMAMVCTLSDCTQLSASSKPKHVT